MKVIESTANMLEKLRIRASRARDRGGWSRSECLRELVKPAFYHLESIERLVLVDLGLLLQAVERWQFRSARLRWESLQRRLARVAAGMTTIADECAGWVDPDLAELLERMAGFFRVGGDRRNRGAPGAADVATVAISTRLAEALDEIRVQSRSALIDTLAAEHLHVEIKWEVLRKDFLAVERDD